MLLSPPLRAAPPEGELGGVAARRAKMVESIAALQFAELGNPQLQWDAIPPVIATSTQPHQLLVVLVEFADRGFERFKGDTAQGGKLAAWYQEQLFDPSYQRPNTLSHYYREQSLGLYHLQGRVLPPIRVSKPRAHYGAPKRPEGGQWRNDSDAQGLVEEALALAVKANPELPWADFDRFDPHDFDGDEILGEADGYLDHLVLVYAGGGQSSCQLLHRLDRVFNPNVGPEVLEDVTGAARECAERIWPHRFMVQKREGQGPRVEGMTHARGGTPLSETLWSLDYNMQSEYTEASTFIHEFGHSIGLPDVYARTSSNSSGAWEVMSGTASPSPQSLSAWSRLMLGWLRPRVVLPPAFGGRKLQSCYLRTLDDGPANMSERIRDGAAGVHRAAMVVLPPKIRELKLTRLGRKQGKRALYSGQGNALNRSMSLHVTLPEKTRRTRDYELAFDAWWKIEGGWDFAYLETSVDEGRSWTRRRPVSAGHMPAKKGHDGGAPGLTGLSGDLDGDGKNESRRGCNPRAKLAHGEDRAGQAESPCQQPSWVRLRFDLSDLKGQAVRVRLRYYTDTAAVEPGLLLDNLTLPAAGIKEGFEGKLHPAIRLDGFTLSPGHHTLLVPHFYLLEHRDPYAPSTKGNHRYDSTLAKARTRFYWNPQRSAMHAVEVRPRPGVLAWYYNGAYAWSENDPAMNGQGRGFLLALDSQPSEIPLEGLDAWFVNAERPYESHYEVSAEAAQSALRRAFQETVCFVRNPDYRPRDAEPKALAALCAERGAQNKAGMTGLARDARRYLYGYEVINALLPGDARARVSKAGELYDYRHRKGKLSYRLRDRTLRYLHTLDAPFALEPFEDGVVFYRASAKGLKRSASRAHPSSARFDDTDPSRWKNPKLYFGGVDVPSHGFHFQLAKPKSGVPDSARVKVWFSWDR